MKMKTILGLIAFLLFSVCATVQIRAQKSTPSARAADPCGDAKLRGYIEGGKDFGNLGLILSSTELSKEERQIPIQIVVKNINGSDAFRLAAAEIIRTHFSDTLKVEPSASLILHIDGTGHGVGAHDRSPAFQIRVGVPARHRFFAGKDRHLVLGFFQFAEDGFTLSNYSPEQTSQAVRESVYKVLVEFVTEWNESKEKTE